jgi:pyrophosphatase PpaX
VAFRILLFDLDGTLLDTNELIIQSFKYTSKKYLNQEMPREHIIKTFGEILQETMEREFGEYAEEALKTYRSFQGQNFYDYIMTYTGVKETIQKLYKKGYKMGVVTSRLRESTVRGLKHFDLYRYFECIISANDTDKHKPDPTPALMALDKMKGKPEEAVLIGDSPFDILCAKNAGILSVAVGWSALPRELYMQHNPDYVIESMEEFVDILDKLNSQ